MQNQSRDKYLIATQHKTDNSKIWKIGFLLLMVLIYLNKKYYISRPQSNSLMSLFGLDKPAPSNYAADNYGINNQPALNAAEKAYIPKDNSVLSNTPKSNTSTSTTPFVDTVQDANAPLSYNIITKPLSTLPDTIQYQTNPAAPITNYTDIEIRGKGIPPQYLGDNTTNVVFTGSFEKEENANRMLKRLKNIGYNQAEIIMKTSFPYYTVVSGFYKYKSSARAEVNALRNRGIESYKAKKQWTNIYRK